MRRFLISLLFLGGWLIFMAGFNLWYLFQTHWPVSATMVFGSFVAGATAEGGGAVAFPVFTKILAIPASTARDFSLAIQSVGMTCGALLIVRSGYAFLSGVLGWSFLGAAMGVIIGLEWIAPLIVPPYPKIFFSIFTLSFGGFLWWLNRGHRELRRELACDLTEQKIEFLLVGLCGGLVASIVGSGADVVLFIYLCLRYDLDEKIATRTTVFLMACVSMTGFAFQMLSGSLAPDVLSMWVCAAPIVAFGAPLGALVCHRQKREHVVAFLLALILLEFLTTIWLVPFTPTAKLVSLVFLAGSSGFFLVLRKYRKELPC
jgi:uncharacterized membrane protein YfcA